MTSPVPSIPGELLKMGPPATGTVLIAMDARQAGAPFTAALQTLFPGGELPVHRLRDWTEVWVVLKGQGRVTVGDRVNTAVHGAVLTVPKGTWFGIRNTGNGPLQAVVVSAPAGVDELFRKLSALGAAPDASAVAEIAAQARLGASAHRHRVVASGAAGAGAAGDAAEAAARCDLSNRRRSRMRHRPFRRRRLLPPKHPRLRLKRQAQGWQNRGAGAIGGDAVGAGDAEPDSKAHIRQPPRRVSLSRHVPSRRRKLDRRAPAGRSVANASATHAFSRKST
jgi:mannose-6-phosphate isomerase-like protein (cupin superfamily)